jgi:hypothetical protein
MRYSKRNRDRQCRRSAEKIKARRDAISAERTQTKIDHLIRGGLWIYCVLDHDPRMIELDASDAYKNSRQFAIVDGELALFFTLGNDPHQTFVQTLGVLSRKRPIFLKRYLEELM